MRNSSNNFLAESLSFRELARHELASEPGNAGEVGLDRQAFYACDAADMRDMVETMIRHRDD